MRVRRVIQFCALQLVVAFLPAGLGADAFAQCPDARAALARADVEFEGRLGAESVRLYLAVVASEEGYATGVEGAARRSAPSGTSNTTLKGFLGNDCVLRLDEDDRSGIRATWVLRYATASRMVGQHEEWRGDTSDVVLQAVAPPGCNGPGPWTTFQSAAWPITFDYPSSWDLTTWVDRDGTERLSVTCPNLKARHAGQDYVEAARGVGTGTTRYGLDDGRAYRQVDRFFTADGREWRAGEAPGRSAGGEPPAPGTPARQAIVAGMTVLQAPMFLPTRTLVRFVFLLPDRWIALESPASDLDIAGPGDLILGGDIASRVVKSLRTAP